jgi:hypothetical protein
MVNAFVDQFGLTLVDGLADYSKLLGPRVRDSFVMFTDPGDGGIG